MTNNCEFHVLLCISCSLVSCVFFMFSYNFTGLPDDTLFAITIIGSSAVVNTDPTSTHSMHLHQHEILEVASLYQTLNNYASY